ncbi:MAG: GNAT family N-acetyltransferase [Chloroflexi bacterium RBG_16_56_11]|nr:MAG: GNAT family N-acetyltransferase [Chloroflexi bacterium RBG_16_56_11]
MSLSMRKAEKKDIEDLCVLMDEMSHTAISREDMLNRMMLVEESQIDSLYVCEEDGEILGLLGFRLRENLEEMSRFGEISAIVVYPGNKRNGVGRFMMDYAEKLAREYNCKGMWLVSGFAREQEAHKFYERLGYKVTGYRFIKLFN